MAQILYTISVGGKSYYTTLSVDIIQCRRLFQRTFSWGRGGGKEFFSREKHWLIFGSITLQTTLAGIKFFCSFRD